jgi:hypothetical protein
MGRFFRKVFEIQKTTKPKSDARKLAAEAIKNKIEELENEEYLSHKRRQQEFMAAGTSTDPFDVFNRETWIKTVLHHEADARKILFINAMQEPGKSKVTYSRKAEEECKKPY